MKTIEVTNALLEAIYINSKRTSRDLYIAPMNDTLKAYDINSPIRLCAYLAQIGHECGELSTSVENLNFSATALLSLFGKYFKTEEEAKKYARKPEAIANKVYANRMGNGNDASGDGWRYRGRGLIQLTGKENYQSLSIALKEDFIIFPDLLSTPKYAALSSGWYWKKKKLNERADKMILKGNDEEAVFKEITYAINGGYNGYEHRLLLYNRAKKVIL